MITFYRLNDIGIIEFNDTDSKVNLLSTQNIDAINKILDRIYRKHEDTKALFFISKKRAIFLAGADIKELAAISTKEEAEMFCKNGQGLCNRIEQLPLPKIAVIDGVCLGGGIELALSCNYIIATDSKRVRIGFPEVKLGITPGFGGSYRLREKIGKEGADFLIGTGEIIDVKEARRMRIVDWLISDSERHNYPYLLKLIQGLPLPQRAILGNRMQLDLKERIVLADKIFEEPARQALSMHMLVNKFKRYQWFRQPSDEIKIHKCMVIGAGTMGSGIVYLLSAMGNLSVFVRELNARTLKKAQKDIKNIYKDAVDRGLIGGDEARSKYKKVYFSIDDLKPINLIIESITEDPLLKGRLLRETEKGISKNSIIATNTSCISVTRLASFLENPERFLGMHFFNPAYKMRLVEVAPTKYTKRAVTKTAISFLQKLGRIPIPVRDKPGFLVNRILLPYLNEALVMVQEGIGVLDIEKTMLDFGMPMGPFSLLRHIGLEVACKAIKILEHNLGGRVRLPDSCKEIGHKSIQLVAKDVAKRHTLRPASKNYIIKRLLVPMRREAELCLKEKIVQNHEVIDLALFLGIGFPKTKRIWTL